MTRPANNFEQRLVAALQQEASLAMTTTDTPRELDRWREQQHRRSNRWRIGLAVAAAAAIVAAILGVTFGLVGSDSSRPEPARPQPTPNPSTPATVALSTLDRVGSGTEMATVTGPVSPRVFALGAVWATGIESTEDKLYRLDPDTGDILSTITFTPYRFGASLPGRVGDAVLVPVTSGKRNGYTAFNRSGSAAGFLPAREPGLVTGDPNGGWVQLTQRTIGQIDATGTHVVQRVRIGKERLGSVIRGLAINGDTVYVATQNPSAIHVVDARSGKETATIELDSIPAEIAVTPSAVYVATESYELLRVDPALKKVTAVSSNQTKANSWFIPFTGPDGSVWVTPNQGGVAELDPTTLRPLRTYQIVPSREAGANFGGVVTPHRLFVGWGWHEHPARTLSIPLD